ncbi:DUF4258 domain-containing protein [Butyricicoccus sp. 1XD8-22]|nr:DUF4258 domain-containing protein [Butyricicoccus sp. 1XD8-22]
MSLAVVEMGIQENKITIEKLREKLFLRKVKVLSHSLKRMQERGYTNEDVRHAILYGEITHKQRMQGQNRYVVESFDTDFNPIVLIVTIDRDEPEYYSVVSVMPPIKEKFKRRIGTIMRKVVA